MSSPSVRQSLTPKGDFDFERYFNVPGFREALEETRILAKERRGGDLNILPDESRRALDRNLEIMNAAFAADGHAPCTIDAPPTAAVTSVIDEQTNIVLRCGHSPAYHEWDLAGKRIK